MKRQTAALYAKTASVTVLHVQMHKSIHQLLKCCRQHRAPLVHMKGRDTIDRCVWNVQFGRPWQWGLRHGKDLIFQHFLKASGMVKSEIPVQTNLLRTANTFQKQGSGLTRFGVNSCHPKCVDLATHQFKLGNTDVHGFSMRITQYFL